MESEIIKPENKDHWLTLRTQDITSTEASVLFSLSPYMTVFELWHLKKDKAQGNFQESERMQWGNALESAIAEEVLKRNNWTGQPMKDYMRDPSLKLGSSFDYFIETPEGPGILEIKNVDGIVFKRNWKDNGDGNYEAPHHIEIQVQHQMAVSGRSFAYIAALVGGNQLVLVKRERNEDIIQAIKDRVKSFWETIDKVLEPAPDFDKDADFIKKMYDYAEPNKVIDSTASIEDAARRYKIVSEDIKNFEHRKKAIQSEILQLIGDAEKVKGTDFTISAGIVGESEVSYTRKSYRNMRINWRRT